MFSAPGFRSVPQTGVIYVVQQASLHGYTSEDPSWVNLGQGAPETAAILDAPPRIAHIDIPESAHEYSSVSGDIILRKKIAELYNTLYRQNKTTQYTHENVSISGGGRIALARIAASLGNINMGHFIPDYTAYEELLSIFKAFIPIPLLLDPILQYHMPIESLEQHILGLGLKALLISNPCNPTGQVIQGETLREWTQLAGKFACSLIIDEFYSHYIYSDNHAFTAPVSAAAYIEDVNRDPIIIVDGLTKNWRYPGWRISWTIAPKTIINTITSAGSFLDGGANHAIQLKTLELLEPAYVLQDTQALQACFRKKRAYTLDRLRHMGICVEAEPQGTFYIWANLKNLPPPLNNGISFFEAALKEKVIVVPGIFFDVNPEKRRSRARFESYVRISFGPELEKLTLGLDNLERMIQKHLLA
ncbi:MAG: pyridoxal phosphate-dependent aminotransferase [Legionellaceae bacterium]|nr:pyridoxal phosphate-dependent aminotransferase [Legionellaceae bacterium]